MPQPVDEATPNARRASMWRRYARFWRPRVDADVDDELAFHIEMRTREYIALGMSASDARAAAIDRLGDLDAARDVCLTIGHRGQRRMTRAHLVDALQQDIVFALRTLSRGKAWTFIAVLTLALGVGTATAVFSIVNTMVLRPIDFAHVDRVFLLWRADPKSGIMIAPAAEAVIAWTKNAHALEDAEQFGQGSMTVTGGGDPVEIGADWMDRGLPAFAGIPPLLGRTFTADEAADSSRHVVILGEGLWRTRFASSRDVLGKTLSLDGAPYTIVGVLPDRFHFPQVGTAMPVQIWLPLVPGKSRVTTTTVVRLRAGVSVEQAMRELDQRAARVPEFQKGVSRSFRTRLMPPGHFNGWHDSLLMVSIAVALLLLIACANVAHLLLARGAVRERELAIRRALGAAHSRIVRQLLTESTVLSLIGCAAGLVVARIGLSVLVAMRPQHMDQLTNASLNGRVLGVSLIISAATAVLFGLVGALHSARHATAESLKGTAGSTTANVRAYRVRSALVVTEMALSAMLLVGAVLLVRSVIKLQHVDPGFDTRDLYSMQFKLPQMKYIVGDSDVRGETARAVLEGARNVPGVAAATTAASAPPELSFMLGDIELDDGTTPKSDSFNAMNEVRPEYFALMRIPLIAGHGFDAGSEDRKEVVINEGMAQRFWPGRPAVGHRFRFKMPAGLAGPAPWFTVVGVARNVVVRALNDDPRDPFLYMPSRYGLGFNGFTLIVRTQPGTTGETVASALRRLSLSVNKSMAPPPITSFAHSLESSIATQRFTTVILTTFAVLAVVLAAVGLFGVISYMVTQRTREIGIRIALGATGRNIARVVVTGGVALSTIGLLIGLVASAWGTKLIRTTLYGVGTTDPVSFAIAAVLLLGVSIAACLVPVRRATRVDPLIAMRAE